ncbi:MAG: L-threonylcarbamoyladenylate synthase [Thermoleophilia bacterium]
MTSVLKLENMTMADFEHVAAALREGGLVCLPADTVYGLASIPHLEATEKIYEAKGRAELKPLALVFTEATHIVSMVTDLPEVIAAALPKLMPGPVTCILPLASPLSGMEFHSADSVGVRIVPPPSGDLYKHLPSPLAVTSANLSGQPDACAVDEILEEITAACDFVIDGGRSRLCAPSTIVDLRPLAAGEQPLILREGPMRAEEILRRLRSLE